MKRHTPSNAIVIGAVFLLCAGLIPASAATSMTAPAGEDEGAVEYQKLLDQGLTAFVEEKYDESVASFNKALLIRPNDPTALNALKRAEEKFSKEGSKKNNAFERELDKANRFMDQKEYIVTLMTIRSILKQSPRYRSALKLQEKLLKKMQQATRKESQDSHRHWIAAGLVYSIEDRPDDAVAAWRHALKLRPDDQIVQLAIEELRPGAPVVPAAVPLPAPAATAAKPSASGIVSTVDLSEPCDCDVSSMTVKGSKDLALFKPLGVPVQSPPLAKPVPPAPIAQKIPAEKAPSVQEEVKSKIPVALPVQNSASTSKTPERMPEGAPVKTPEPVVMAVVSEPVPPPPAPSAGPGPEDLLSRQDYEGAIRLLERRIAADSTDLAARELLNRARSEREQASNVHYRKGLLAYAEGNFAEAIEEWKSTLKIYPEHPNAKKVLLRAFFKSR